MKKMNVLAASIAMALAGNAMAMDAPSIKFQLRGDLIVDDTKADPDNITTTEMEMPYMRLDVKGKIKDDLSYRVKYRLNGSTGLARGADRTGTGVDYAYVTKKVSDKLKVKIGKQYINIGGYESFFSSRDTYSQGSLTWNTQSSYRTGVGAFYKFGDHSVNVQVANNDQSNNQDDMLYGFQAVFSFADGMLNPLVSYHLDSTRSDIAAGLRLKVDALTVDVDHLITQYEAAGQDDDVSTTVFAKYKVGDIVPQARYTIAENGALDSFDSYHVAVEYFPYGDSSFRYHVAIAGTDTKGVVAAADDESMTFTTGFALSF